MMLKDLKIATQLRLGLGLLVVFVVATSALAWRQTDRLWLQTKLMYDHPLQVRRAVDRLAIDVESTSRYVRDLLLAQDDREAETFLASIKTNETDVERQISILDERYLGPREHVSMLEDDLAIWSALRAEAIRLIRAGETSEALARIRPDGIHDAALEKVRRRIRTIDEFALNKAAELAQTAGELNTGLNQQLLVAVFATLLLSLLVSWSLISRIKAPLVELITAADRFRQGHFDARCLYASGNEFGALSTAFNALADRIQADRQSTESAARLAEVMLRENELQSFCRGLLEALLEHTGSQVGAVYLLNEQRTDFEHFASIGLAAAGRASFSATGFEGEFGAALTSQKVQIVTDIPADSRFTFATVSGNFQPRAIITIPVIGDGRVVAMISLAGVHNFEAPAVRLVHDVWGVLTARVTGVLASTQIGILAGQLERQNADLNDQKVELSAQAVELEQQSRALHEQNAELEAQAARVIEANRLKSEFLSNMSHELRTPLNSVLALSGVLRMQGKGRFSTEEISYLEIIERNGKHLLELINDILDLARIESGRMEISSEELSLRATIAAVADNLQPICQDKGIALTSDVAAGLPHVWSDRRRLHQIIQNIVGNAVKFTDSGQVRVTARTIGDEVEVIVADTGIGIPEKDQPFIFDEFRRADETSTRSHEGTGLGLAIAAKAVRLLGGRITVASTPGAGSVFTVRLPLIAPHTTVQPVAADVSLSPALRSGMTVLVIDDDPNDAGLIAAYLAAEGYDTLVAHSGQEALRLAGIHRPFAITLDVIMPEMDGWEVLQALKHNPATALIPVIIVSMSQDRETGLALGAISVVAKPVRREALLAEVRRVAPAGSASVPASVLVVDDDDGDRKLIADILMSDGFEVRQARDGKQCLALVAERRPDVVALDLVMPGTSGFDVLEALRNDPATRQLPVVVVTARDLTIEDRRRLHDQAAAVVEKSRLKSGDLLAEIGRILERLGKRPVAPLARGARLLLVEDSEPAILQIRMVLESAGYAVSVARGGSEALASINTAVPDGIILDLMMPEMDGLAVLERLRQTPGAAHTPVLILTAKDLTAADLARLSANNVRQLIQKGDVDRAELLLQVKRLLGRTPAKAVATPVPAAALHMSVRARPPAGKLPVILVVEDNPDSLATFGAILAGRCTLLEAEDGVQGLRRAFEERPDLILLDLSLPKLDGLAVVRRLRADSATQEIPVIAVTARAMKGDREQALAAGCDDFVAKPVDVHALLETIERWLGRLKGGNGHAG